MLPPDDVPELLGLIAHDLHATLGRLSPAMPDAERERLAVDLMHSCRTTIGGHRLPAAPRASASDLRGDPAYGRLHDAWRALIAERCGMPDAWSDVAVLHLIDALRATAKGAHIPKTLLTTEHDAKELWRRYKGNIRALALEVGISSERLRQKLKPFMAAESKRRQPDLFNEDQT
ncbi:hypothetical protein ACNQFN_11305 [Thauera butanivorans]|uniref:hypothetical protein n=1 Tax=Thauera butanivorans TaxID=86174 RepID=UPI003AB19DB4